MKKIDNGNRRDYDIGYNGAVYFVEVHSANTSEVCNITPGILLPQYKNAIKTRERKVQAANIFRLAHNWLKGLKQAMVW